MSDTSLARPHSGLAGLIERVIEGMSTIPYWFTALVLRIPIAAVFWRSGQTKIDGWHLSSSAVDLFRDEYRLPIIDPTFAAYLSAFAEHFFPALLVVGLATRFSALALLIMTLVIEIFVYPDAWPTHGTWAACFLVLMVQGPGKISLDHWIAQRFR
jgi:putative oxidoreductase